MQNASADYELFSAGDIELQSNARLPDAHLAYRTFGSLNAEKSNVVLFPTWYSSQHPSNYWLIGEDKALDPARWFIVVVNMLANGLSSSPSNTPTPNDRTRFPTVTILDNVTLQRRLLRERFGIERLALVVGRSMGALQAYQWASYFPDEVDRIFALCGAARVSRHNYIFLAGLKAALTADSGWKDGEYDAPPEKGLKAFGRCYAGWIYSQDWYRQEIDRGQCDEGLELFLEKMWDGAFLQRDANNLLSQLHTWQHANIASNAIFSGDFDRALGAIQARAIVMPSLTDMYFTPKDSAYEVSRMRNAELRVIPSAWGHRAGGPNSDPVDIKFVQDGIRDLLKR